VPQDVSEALYRRAGEPKRLVVVSGFGHYEVDAGEAFWHVMALTLGWFQQYLPPL